MLFTGKENSDFDKLFVAKLEKRLIGARKISL